MHDPRPTIRSPGNAVMVPRWGSLCAMRPATIAAVAMATVRAPCTTYRGTPLAPHTLFAARVFNASVAPVHERTPYASFRKLMNDHDLAYRTSRMTVGHIHPRSKGGVDLGRNLFAQHEVDNRRLGARIVSEAELTFYCRRVVCDWNSLVGEPRHARGRTPPDSRSR